jgi:ABC-type transport system involved in multi-copper enzyme maturation permease subunit
LFINTVIMTSGLLAVLYFQDVPIHTVLFKALGMIMLEFMVITAVALLFSTFSSATLSAIFTLAIYVIGHLTPDLKAFGQKMEGTGRTMLEGIYYILPNLDRFNLKGHVTHQLEVPAGDLLMIAAYGVAYTGFLLMLASIIFQQRDFR